MSDTTQNDAPFQVLSAEEIRRREEELRDVMEVVAQAVKIDGGEVEVIDVDVSAGVVHVRLSGACGSCAVAGSTLEDGIERVLRQRLDWVREVRGDVIESDVVGRGGWRALL